MTGSAFVAELTPTKSVLLVWIVVPISLVSFGARKFQGEVYQHDVQRDGQIAMRSPGRLKCRRNHILSGLLPIEP